MSKTTTATVERPLTEDYQEFLELMGETAKLKPQQQERLNYFLRGYVTASAYINEQDKAAI